MIIISQEEATRHLSMEECIGVMEEVFSHLASGNKVILPVRTVMKIPDNHVLGLMPSYNGEIEALGVKVVTVFFSNYGTGYDAHQGVVLLYETVHGSLQAIVDATAITGIRTAAVSAVATRILANPDAGDLAILGAGTQGFAHLYAMSLIRPLKRVRVWSPYPEELDAFSRKAQDQLGIEAEPVESAEKAVVKADLICTATPSKEPILKGDWLEPGVHINAIGACTAVSRELDADAVARSRMFVDSRASTLQEAGDFLLARKEGRVGDEHILGELGQLVTGEVTGRNSDMDITLFKAVGLSVQDLAVAKLLYEKALVEGFGFSTELGGRHQAFL